MSRKSTKIFDDVFRTVCERLPVLLVPLVNEVFGTDYPGDAEIVQYRNEHHFNKGKRTTDSYISINGDNYHIECQSSDMTIMIVRMFEYDLSIAIESKKDTQDGYEIDFPKSCVVYLRGRDKESRRTKIKIRFADGKTYDYRVDVIEVEKYSIDDIFKKDLLMFLPYYILRYEDNLPTGSKKDEDRLKSLMEEYKDIQGRLERSADDETDELFVLLTELIIRISDYVCGSKNAAKKGVREAMDGKVLWDLPSDKMKAKARAEGSDEKGMRVFLNCISRGMDRAEAQAIAEINDELVERALRQVK